MVCNLLILVPTTVLVFIAIRKLRERSWGYCKNKVLLNNKVAIVTGANSGIGYEVAKELAKRNADVILACRNVDSAIEAIAKMEKQLKKKLKLRAVELDLGSLNSVKQFVINIKKLYPEIHLLINNAGVAYPKNQFHLTKDNVEVHFGVNYLGHFYLTTLLLDTLKRSAPSRVIVVSSTLHEKGKIDFTHFTSVPTPDTNFYSDSKLGNVYFAKELAKKTNDSGVNVYALCPGWVYTSLFRHSLRWYHYILVAPIAFFFMRSPTQGAQTVIYCATEPNLRNESGLMYRNCALYTSKVQFDEQTSLKLWEYSERLIDEKMK